MPSIRPLALLSILLLGCGAEKSTPSAAPTPDAANPIVDTGIALDLGVDPEHTLDLQPAVSTVHFDLAAPTTPATQVFWTYADGPEGKTDITSSVTLSLDDATVGSFKENVFESKVPLPFDTLGKTVRVIARRGGEIGIAKLTLVRMRRTGPDRDVLFTAPHGLAPTPDKDMLTAVTPAGATIDVKVVLRNDPANPDGVDAKKLVRVRAMREGNVKVAPPSGPVCEPQSAKDTDADGLDDTFLGVPAGKALCFEATPITNVIVTSKEGAGFHRVFVDLVAMPSGTKLGERSVLIVVPPTDPRAK